MINIEDISKVKSQENIEFLRELASIRIKLFPFSTGNAYYLLSPDSRITCDAVMFKAILNGYPIETEQKVWQDTPIFDI